MPAIVPRDAASQEMRRAPSSVQGSNSCRTRACCRRPGSLGESVDLASSARPRRREPVRAFRLDCRASGSCGIASPGKPAHLAARAQCGAAETRMGIGIALHASITGLHGAYPARRVNVPSATATNRIVSTATGLRRQLFSPSPKMKGKSSSADDHHHGPDEQRGSFQRGRQERKHRIEPQEKEIRARRGLNDGGIRRARRAKRTEIDGAGSDGKQDEGREEEVFPNRAGNEGQCHPFS